MGEVTCGRLPHLPCKSDQIKMRDCMDRRVTSPKQVTAPNWGPPTPCKQALRLAKTTTLHVNHVFCTFFFFAVVARLQRESALFHFLSRTGTQDNDFVFLFLNFDTVL